MAIEWVALGLSVGSLLARIASLSDGPSWDTFADAADSATTLIRATRVENRINPDGQMVKALTSRLQTEHERYLRDYFPSGESDPEVQAVVSNVAEAMMRLASETGSNHARTLLAALEHPEDFLRYVRSHAGDAARRTVSQNAEPAFDYLLAAVSKDLCKLLRTSASAQVTALGELLRLARQTVENHEAVLAALLPPAPKPSPLATLMAASMRAREATRPKYMPAVDRRREFGLGQDGNIATPLVILGEGGAGKSVVAGDLVRWTGEDCLLVPCSRIPANADLGTSDAINIALGDAASDSRDGVPLTEIVSILPGSTLVAIDTIDLLLRFDTADNLLHLITQLKELRPLVLTSREQEWTDLLGRDSFPAHRLGLLSSDQIDEWVEVYLGAQEHVTDETRQSFRNSIQRAVRAGGRVLLGSPIRLAMACALYAADGAVPAGLSVPQLYRDYWDENVDRDRRSRRRTADAEAQQHAAMEVAARIWQSSSGHFVEYVGTSGLPGSAVQDLLSSGVLRSNGALLVGYFHQTFAEFAVARHLAVNGTDLDAQALQNALAANSPAHWGIARYLGWAEMDASQAVRLAKALPDNAEGIRIRLRMLSTHSTPDALTTELLTLGSSSESLLRPAFQALSDADATSTEVVLDMALRLINASSADLSVIAHTIGKVLPKCTPRNENRSVARRLPRTSPAWRTRPHGPCSPAPGHSLRLQQDRFQHLRSVPPLPAPWPCRPEGTSRRRGRSSGRRSDGTATRCSPGAVPFGGDRAAGRSGRTNLGQHPIPPTPGMDLVAIDAGYRLPAALGCGSSTTGRTPLSRQAGPQRTPRGGARPRASWGSSPLHQRRELRGGSPSSRGGARHPGRRALRQPSGRGQHLHDRLLPSPGALP